MFSTSHPTESPRRRVQRAFTLVELLVVIGIIAILMSMLMPALNKARRSVMQVRCQNNLRQIVMKCLMYGNSYRGALPYESRFAAGTWTWPYRLNLAETGDAYKGPYDRTKIEGTIFNCPFVEMGEAGPPNTVAGTWSCHYGWNTYYVCDATSTGPAISGSAGTSIWAETMQTQDPVTFTTAVTKFSQIRGLKVLVGDGRIQYFTWPRVFYAYVDWQPPLTSQKYGPWPMTLPGTAIGSADPNGKMHFHNQVANMAFVDGHVEALSSLTSDMFH